MEENIVQEVPSDEDIVTKTYPTKVFIKVTTNNCVVDINSEIFLTDTTEWVQIDEGYGDEFTHAQGNYLDKPLMEEHGVFQYKYVDGVVAERTPEEIQADIPVVETSITWEDYALDFEFRLSRQEIGGETL